MPRRYMGQCEGTLAVQTWETLERQSEWGYFILTRLMK